MTWLELLLSFKMSLLTLDAQRALLSLAEHVFIWLLPLRKF